MESLKNHRKLLRDRKEKTKKDYPTLVDKLQIDKSICTQCGACASICPVVAIEVTSSNIEVTDACTDCGVCENVCPLGVITIE